jgi:hypothetical protein
MDKAKLFSVVLMLTLSFTISSCGPAIKTTSSWVNREKLPAEPVKSVFIIAFTDKIEVRGYLEEALAVAAQQKGLKTYKSIDVIGPVEIKYIAPVKDVFMAKLQALNCETIFTVALVKATSETKYVDGSTFYSPYSYSSYGGYGGYGVGTAYGGFGGYYGYAVSTVSTPGYYTTNNKYFLESKMFDLKTEELLLSIQTKADNPATIEKSSNEYARTVMATIKSMGLQKK